MPEPYKKAKVEAALIEHGFNILQTTGSFSFYQMHVSPGCDLVIDWSTGQYEWDDLKAQLEDEGIDPEPIHNSLLQN